MWAYVYAISVVWPSPYVCAQLYHLGIVAAIGQFQKYVHYARPFYTGGSQYFENSRCYKRTYYWWEETAVTVKIALCFAEGVFGKQPRHAIPVRPEKFETAFHGCNTARVIWKCACVRWCPHHGLLGFFLCYSISRVPKYHSPQVKMGPASIQDSAFYT